ncbi:MAG: hypothetical protein NVS1B7_6490 [Candidatus Saccharimonadales bacterium]
MTNPAAKRETTNDPVAREMQQLIAAETIKSQFLSSALTMSWRLLIAVVVPIVSGVKIDEHFRTSPAYTLIGLVVAAVAGSVSVWSVIRDLNTAQNTDDATMYKTKRRVKHDK